MALKEELRRASDKIKDLSHEMSYVEKEGFAHALQRKPMFRDKQEAEKYIDNKENDPSSAKVMLVVKEIEETLKNIRWK